eukprot:5218860-Pleurochrysis_carterae.AAC.3
MEHSCQVVLTSFCEIDGQAPALARFSAQDLLVAQQRQQDVLERRDLVLKRDLANSSRKVLFPIARAYQRRLAA